ncbi:MAG: CHASE domain-containing protein, partial [Actinomycetota bacterium]|nr:CHASE domain-containing protein [Actinomycetota bacterium]
MPGRRTLSVFVVLGLLAATAVAAAAAYRSERNQADREDAALVHAAALAARQSVMVAAAGLRGGDALVEDDGELPDDRFATFARSVVKQTPLPGLAWAQRIDGDGAQIEDQIGLPLKQLDAEGGFKPYRGDSNRHLVIRLIHPSTQARRESLGFDLLSDPSRRALYRTANARGAPAISAPMDLAPTHGTGVVLVFPIGNPEGDQPPGVFLAGVPGNAIARALRNQFGIGPVSVSDSGKRLLGSEPEPEDPTEVIDVLGRKWTVSAGAPAAIDLTGAIAFAVGGVILALLAAGLIAAAEYRERSLVRRQVETELKGARESLLTRITEAIEREIEGDARLASLARTTVPAVGDICVIHEVTAMGEVRRVGVAAPDERTAELIRSLPEPASTDPIRAAIASREPVLYTRIAENREAQRASARGIAPRLRPGAEELSPEAQLLADLRSSLIVPLVARDRVLGTMSLSVLASTGRPPLTRDDLAFAMEVATHAAVALDNSRLYEQQRDIAAILQEALLPRSLPEVSGAEVAVRHRAGMIGTEVGGDFYDLFGVGDHWIAVVGDVCGKGPEAAALTALARHTIRATAENGAEEAVRRVHEAIRGSGESTYCTLCCAELRAGAGGIAARVVTAGHPEPRLISATGDVQRLD